MVQISGSDPDACDTVFIVCSSLEQLAGADKYIPGADGRQYAVYHVKGISGFLAPLNLNRCIFGYDCYCDRR